MSSIKNQILEKYGRYNAFTTYSCSEETMIAFDDHGHVYYHRCNDGELLVEYDSLGSIINYESTYPENHCTFIADRDLLHLPKN